MMTNDDQYEHLTLLDYFASLGDRKCQGMARADILISSLSSLSWTAAVLNTRLVLHPKTEPSAKAELGRVGFAATGDFQGETHGDVKRGFW